MSAFVVPWPPSTNTYWRHPSTGALAGRTLISEKGRAFRAECLRQAIADRWPRFGAAARLSVRIEAFPPDRRRRDLDNMLKAALDALTHAGVWSDDSQIDELQIVRRPVGGYLSVSVEEAV